jgi:hypothetical protein
MEDLVDEFYRPLVQSLGNLVILFAQAEAALNDLVSALIDADEWQAQAVLKRPDAKDQVLSLVTASQCLDQSARDELLTGVETFWTDKDRRNRYVHDEWFPLVGLGGAPATRGLPRKKGSEVVFDEPAAGDIWALARSFRDYSGLFEHASWAIRQKRTPNA